MARLHSTLTDGLYLHYGEKEPAEQKGAVAAPVRGWRQQQLESREMCKCNAANDASVRMLHDIGHVIHVGL